MYITELRTKLVFLICLLGVFLFSYPLVFRSKTCFCLACVCVGHVLELLNGSQAQLLM